MRRSTAGRAWVLAGVAVVMALRFIAPVAGQVDEQVDVEAKEAAGWTIPDDLTLRARVTAMTPAAAVDITWRHGGEGLGGEVVRGTLGKGLAVGQWSEPVPLPSLVTGKAFPRLLFVTISAEAGGKAKNRAAVVAEHSTNVMMEFEYAYQGKAIKTIQAAGPNGGSYTLVIRADRLAGGKKADDAGFVKEGLIGLKQYVQERTDLLEGLPWKNGPVPQQYAIITNAGGYGVGTGRGVRHTDPEIFGLEMRSLRQLGVNGVRGEGELEDVIEVSKATGQPNLFLRGFIGSAAGYPVTRAVKPPAAEKGAKGAKGTKGAKGATAGKEAAAAPAATANAATKAPRPGKAAKAANPDPEAGCPFAPGVAERTKAGIEKALGVLRLPVGEVWALTDDEIGSVFGAAPDGRSHLAHCDYCAEGYRQFLKDNGATPADFGKKDWSEVRPLDLGGKGAPPLTFDQPGKALNAYYTWRFINYASAKLFTPLRQAYAAENQKKQAALDSGKTNTPEAKQPWIYSYALRGNTFLLNGGALDFFEFYRLADNGFCYETSNRDARVWEWDSYLCDVGRVVSNDQKLAFGVYVKPHRGAPVQRALAAVSRGARMVYWYTYGPDYNKGDSFSEKPEAVKLTSKAAHLIGKAEDALYGSQWAHPAEVAIVKPMSLQAWQALTGDPAWAAAWENAKWTYTALQHAHVPVDPIDEVMIEQQDLSKYKVIYYMGPNITRAAAKKLAAWVNNGGTLYTSGYGLARDEANRPLDELLPVLGLAKRNEPEMRYQVQLYGATKLEPYDDPKRVIGKVPEIPAITGGKLMSGSFQPLIGREVLVPAAGTEVLAKFADGSAAATVHNQGKGKAYVVGCFAGLEYSAPLHVEAFDMVKDLSGEVRSFTVAPALAVVRPVVDAGAPTVEGVLLKNAKTGAQAVTLANWGYRVAGQRTQAGGGKKARVSNVIENATETSLKIAIRGAGPVKTVRSAMLDQDLPVTVQGDVLTVTLPKLEEGDVLMLK